jgi:LutB-like iron-sulfur protein
MVFKVWAKVMMSPSLYKLGALAGRMMQRVMPLSRAWAGGRDLRPIERQSFRELWKTKYGRQ